ncbi:sugar ABC transporter substrate-binding protein [Paenibacillus sp. KQZ6P-2]|uniref:Sugar ABC transporter substrate-binding protein n=1 Tax=Paenibacillus mangrovi TaxID=2931978 RepID=A0A9X2B1K6_9BACL|nr:sugar ABC transporter substrate-binding protein [Paenibacillus mangrovi]MCJ8010965.1 sugar ABC transporter substrate-binding protein [Paenibacillus mangrovi]
MKKKILGITTTVVMLASLLAGCSGSSNSSTASGKNTGSTDQSKPVTIKFLNWEKPSVYQPAIDAFEKKYPNIKVEYIPLVENDSNETLKKIDIMYASGEDFDVFSLNSLPNLSQRASNGMLEPLDDYINAEGIKYEDEYKAEQMKLDNKRYSLPGKFGPWFILMNKDRLDEAGLSVPTSWTWDEFRDYSKQLTKGEGATKSYGTFFHTWKDYFLLRLYSSPENQGIMTDDGKKLNDENPLMKESLELRYNMEYVDHSAMPYQDVVSQKIPYRDAYFQGKASMLPTGPWMISEAGGTDKIPATFHSAFAPWPKNNASDENYSFGGADSLVISSNSKHKQESYEFIRFLSTEGMSLTKQLSAWKKADLNQEVDAIISATMSPDMIDKNSLINTLSVMKLPTPPVAVPYSADLEKGYIAEAEKYMLGETDIDTTMKNIKVNLQKIIDANQ